MIIVINDYPLKNVNFDLVEDPKAHLDTDSQEKNFRVIIWDEKNSHLKNCAFPKEETYLYELLNPQEIPQEEEERQLSALETASRSVRNWRYVADIVDPTQKVYFYDIPQLGSQIAISIKISFYSTDKILWEAVQKITTFNQKMTEY